MASAAVTGMARRFTIGSRWGEGCLQRADVNREVPGSASRKDLKISPRRLRRAVPAEPPGADVYLHLPFTTEDLGTGLRSLRYTQPPETETHADAGGRTLVAGMRCARRREGTGCDVAVIASAPDPRRVLGVMDDLYEFVRRVGMPGPS
ncbi:hypothetical protein [Streptomyces sp. PA5.6]|uniref:hypothetical protein n=1 Tax=Streptomyces sp. PA5.6 TaxID=3035651 RepID=UPI003904BECF